ncbi:MAG: helix-turn-helix domain-containing protein [Cellvibrio sp.]|jgi:Transcriptional regulator containing an amidase domain and an AraC-type DNA-binding HTH domain
MSPPSSHTTKITFFLCENMLATSSTLPMEMLLAAESAAHRGRKSLAPHLKLRTAAVHAEPVVTRSGFAWRPDCALEDATDNDIIYLPGLWRNPRPLIRRNGYLLEWLRDQYQNGALISAVGTGCCFLAEAGLLDGKPATTHWHYFDQFHRDYPAVDLKRQYFITQAGNLYCSASVNSLADLTVHFIHRLMGKAIASHVERHFSHEIRRSYESSGYFEQDHSRHPDEDIVQVQIWLQDNYHRNISFEQVAERFGLSVRTLNRRFKIATGQTPLQHLQEIRIHTARDLLKTSNLSINEIAEKVGYQDAGYFTILFKKQLATTPKEYRATVRAKLFSSDQRS